jgi:hypothetical protein
MPCDFVQVISATRSGVGLMGSFLSGGVAALNHRLISATPTGVLWSQMRQLLM